VITNVIQLGRVPYALGLKIQAELVAARKSGQINDTLVLLEHGPVITLGRNAKAAHVVSGREELAARGVEVFECDRGGDVTFHGPGQLVGYPIFDLVGHTPRIGVVEYLRRIEEALIRTCAAFGIAAGRVQGLTGVWTGGELRNSVSAEAPNSGANQQFHNFAVSQFRNQERKLAAIGVHISRGVTSHGFALNVNTDLDYFQLIVPCGISDRAVTSMQRELGPAPDMTEVAEATARSFGKVFGSEVLWLRNLDELLGRKVGVPRQPAEWERIEQVRNA
jgi:lipoyl(octanoyl) transferase